MTLERDIGFDVFGLEGTFPRPGWVVLDAARQHSFTGELTFETIPTVKVYLDGGLIYLAERVTDPSLGSRLVDAGALNAAQLEHGSMEIGEVAHLGRLFERVPSVNRHTVMVMTEMMTEECVGWLAGQMVQSVEVARYRHHPAGVQRWLQPVAVLNLAPGDPLPAPAVDAIPVELRPPEPLFPPETQFDDGLITWAEPGWLDEPLAGPITVDSTFDQTPRATVDTGVAPVFDDEPTVATPESPTSPVPVGAAAATLDTSVPPVVHADPDTDVTVGSDSHPDETAHDEWGDLPELPVRIPNASVTEPDATVEWSDLAPTESARRHDAAFSDAASPDTDPDDVDDGVLAAQRDWADLVSAVIGPATPVVTDSASDQPALAIESTLDQLMGLPAEPPMAAFPATDYLPSVDAPVTSDLQSPSPVLQPTNDWVDQLYTDQPPRLGSTSSADAAPVDESVAAEHFELIWPSGETDDQLGSPDDHSAAAPDVAAAQVIQIAVPTAGTPGSAAATLEHEVRDSISIGDSSEPDAVVNGHDEVTDEVVLAVRRAVASIETNSLAARRRLVTTDPAADPSRGIDRRSTPTIRSLRPVSATSDALTPGANSARRVPTQSVFDDDVRIVSAEPTLPVVSRPPVAEPAGQRVGALRRLIGSLRGR